MTSPLILRCNTDEVGVASKDDPGGAGSTGLRASRLASLAPQHEGGWWSPRLAGLVWFFLLTLTLCGFPEAFAVQPDEQLADPVLEARARGISEGLRCLVCQNQSIDDSDAPLARDLRLLVRARLQAGDTDDAVRNYLVARYGDFILLKPPFDLQTLLLWLTPVVVLGAGALLAVVRHRRPPASGERLSAGEEENLARILGNPE